MSPNQDVRELILKANAVPSIMDLIFHHLKEQPTADSTEDALRLLGKALSKPKHGNFEVTEALCSARSGIDARGRLPKRTSGEA